MVKVVNVPGSVTPHLSDQSGLFTVHPHIGERGGRPFEILGLEREFGILPNTPFNETNYTSKRKP